MQFYTNFTFFCPRLFFTRQFHASPRQLEGAHVQRRERGQLPRRSEGRSLLQRGRSLLLGRALGDGRQRRLDRALAWVVYK